MKTTGWVLLIIGILGCFGALMAGHNITGPVFWGALGAYLIYRANQKEQEKKDKDAWSNNQKL